MITRQDVASGIIRWLENGRWRLLAASNPSIQGVKKPPQLGSAFGVLTPDAIAVSHDGGTGVVILAIDRYSDSLFNHAVSMRVSGAAANAFEALGIALPNNVVFGIAVPAIASQTEKIDLRKDPILVWTVSAKGDTKIYQGEMVKA